MTSNSHITVNTSSHHFTFVNIVQLSSTCHLSRIYNTRLEPTLHFLYIKSPLLTTLIFHQPYSFIALQSTLFHTTNGLTPFCPLSITRGAYIALWCPVVRCTNYEKLFPDRISPPINRITKGMPFLQQPTFQQFLIWQHYHNKTNNINHQHVYHLARSIDMQWSSHTSIYPISTNGPNHDQISVTLCNNHHLKFPFTSNHINKINQLLLLSNPNIIPPQQLQQKVNFILPHIMMN